MSYIPQTRDETDVLFVLLSERYERRSVVVTSNLLSRTSLVIAHCLNLQWHKYGNYVFDSPDFFFFGLGSRFRGSFSFSLGW
jgi:hypothetical protein